MRIVAVIPARYASTRFPGKPLALIAGKTMIERVYRQAVKAKVFNEVIVATDDSRIMNEVNRFGGTVVMTNTNLPSGTDRVAAAVKNVKADWVMNLQGDEPLIAPALLNTLVKRIGNTKTPSIITAVETINSNDLIYDPNCVKVVVNSKGDALYFSRSPIPFTGRAPNPRFKLLKHIGLYLYHRKALELFVSTKPSLLEKVEKLEQLRAYEIGIPIKVVVTGYHPINVDIPEDIAKVERALQR